MEINLRDYAGRIADGIAEAVEGLAVVARVFADAASFRIYREQVPRLRLVYPDETQEEER